MKIRIKFAKSGVMKFIGHLDMMRYFQKAIRRAGVNICYSEGFSPHMIMSFAAPLGVGITSDGEYFDIEVKDTMTTADALQALNSTMVQGVEVTGYVQLPEDAKNAMSIVAAADYTLGYKDGYHSPFTKSQWKEALEKSFHSKETFMVTKKTKKNQVEVDLKPAVYTLEMVGTEENPAFHIFVSAGSTRNIKPEFVLESIYNRISSEEGTELSYDPHAIAIHRNDVFAAGKEEGTFISLLEFGQEIC